MLREGRGPRQVVDTSRRRYLLQGSACSFVLKRNLNLKDFKRIHGVFGEKENGM